MSNVTSRLLLPICILAAHCDGARADEQACRAIFNRIVDIELEEQGFRDPALANRKRNELRATFADELRRCEGRPLAAGALSCVRAAKSTEEVSHVCLK